jgi:signal transduction histidine kinase
MLLDSLRPQAVLAACSSSCPDNPFNIATWSGPFLTTATLVLGATLILILAVAVVSELFWRLRTASRPRRRALELIAPVALVLLAAEVFYAVSGILLQTSERPPAVLKSALIAGFVLLPLAFLATLVQAEILAGRMLRRLLKELSTRPSLPRWRDSVARALDDSSLRLDLWDPDSGRFRAAAPLPSPDSVVLASRQWVPIHRGRDPIAVLSVDERLTEEPELLEAARTATALAVEYTHLEEELRSSLSRVAASGDGERRRIARDLHDCTQQRLVALRVHLSLAGDGLDRPEERAMVERLGEEVDEVLSELRDVTHGFYPVVLSRFGIAAALRSAGGGAALPIHVEDRGLLRHDDAIELAVYFCCLEALQNAAKHAGNGASAVVRLDEQGDELCFEVADDGVGFEPQAVGRGTGLINLADRVSAVGGTLAVESAPGKGARIRGRIAVR